jgi:hypothetical protein
MVRFLDAIATIALLLWSGHRQRVHAIAQGNSFFSGFSSTGGCVRDNNASTVGTSSPG